MIYGSVCSGIEAASVAWHPLGWRPAWFPEIEKFPSAVLAHRWPGVKNHGDFTRIEDRTRIDLLVGGTPCQSFSIAGLRGGLDDHRGNLALEFMRLADRLRPRWIVWENVPGVLSSNGGRDFGSFLGGLVELGYGFAYRVLDAQHFGVPQRRRRVFVVGCLGEWRRAAAVLFERASLRGDIAPSREVREGIAGTLTGGVGNGGAGHGARSGHAKDGTLIAGCLNSVGGHAVPGNSVQDADQGYLQVITHALRADGFDASEDGAGRGTPLIAATLRGHPRPGSNTNGTITFDATQITSPHNRSNTKEGAPCHTLAKGQRAPHLAIGFGHQEDRNFKASVRRLTPRECERLQGFPDDYTLIPYRSKHAADGPRYKALGNSMAVPVMRWIGERIAAVGSIA